MKLLHSLLLAFSFDRIKNKRFWKLLKGKTFTIHLDDKPYRFHSTYLISGTILILIGVLIYNDVLFTLNQYALQTGFVQNIIIGGEEWLKNLFIR